MKRIVCEMCGATEFAKENGMFVCRGCGLQYSLDEAKKIIVDVDDPNIEDNVSRADDQHLNNLYTRARKSLEINDLEHAAEYFKQILDEKPDDWEAYFYSYLGETTSFTNAQAASVAAKLGSTIPMAYDMAVGSGEPNEKSFRAVTISRETAERLTGIALTAVSLLREYEGGFALSAYGQVNASMYRNLRPIAQNTIVNCVLAFEPLATKVEEIFRNQAIDEEAYIECVISLRRAQVNISNYTFSPSAGVTEFLITDTARFSYQQHLSGAEQFSRSVQAKKRAQRAEQERKEREAKQAAIIAYWEAHPEEKKALDIRKQELEERKKVLLQKKEETQQQIKKLANEGNLPVSDNSEILEIRARIDTLNTELKSLGLFKSAEKKAIQCSIELEYRKIDNLKLELKQERDKNIIELMDPLRKDLACADAEISNITDELRKIAEELLADR